MKIIKFFLMIILTIALAFNGNAQDDIIKNKEFISLSDQEKIVFKRVINTLIKDLQVYISIIADKQENTQRRLDAIDQAIQLFVKPDSNIVEVSSKITGKTKQILVKNYFNRLYAIQASRVDITFYEIARLDSLRRDQEGVYHGTAYIYQLTKIYYKDKDSPNPDYVDKTIKKITVLLEPQDYWLKNQRGPKYTPKLSDIKVDETI